MVMRTTILLGTLALVCAFAAGFAFDRWLHRPITAGGMTLQFVSNSVPQAPPRPIPDCMIACEPGDDAGNSELIPEPDTQVSCYGDGSIPCPGPKAQHPFNRPMCWVAPFGFNACQKET